MIRKITTGLSCLFTCMALGTNVFAGAGNTPMQSFINREKESNTFITIGNIWQQDKTFDQTQMLKVVEKAQSLTIDYTNLAQFMKDKNQDIQLVLPKQDGGTYTVSLGRYDFLATGFKVVTNGKGGENNYNYTPGLYYRGVVDGIPGSVAAFSFFNDEVYGIFSIPNEGNYVLAPNTIVSSEGNTQHYVLYNDNDLLIKDAAPKCSADALPFRTSVNAEQRTTTNVGNEVYNSCREVNVYELADYSTYRTKNSNVTTVTNFVTALFNNQSTLYRNEGILVNLKYLKVDIDSDVYYSVDSSQGSIGFLTLFGQQTQNNLNGANVAILLSTKWGGQLGGVAWLQSMCSNYSANQSYGPYAYCNIINNNVSNFPTYSWNVEVLTHEMGHVVGSPHTHACVWNYPGRSTAIDGCYTLEGSCAMPSPQYPTGGGTIMSYCHLTSTGINFSNGFGKQPGDTIRYFLSHNTCGAIANFTTAVSKASRSISANRECLDPATNITYYWNDHNTADQTDDTLALMIKKGTNNIGTLDSTGFSVKSVTVAGYGGGTGLQVTFPSGTLNTMPGRADFSMRRYWQITATTQPSSNVEVIFPFTSTDTADLSGSLASHATMGYLTMYKINSPVDPNPSNGFNGLSASGITTYGYASAASTSKWSLTSTNGTLFAHMLMSNLSGGGSGFISYAPLAVNSVSPNQGVYFYPNPTTDNWNLIIPANYNNKLTLQISAADGKTIYMQSLNGGGTYNINASDLSAGIYFYRLTGADLNATGSLLKNK